MAKEKRPLEDLDAELAALEAELAQLEARKGKKGRKGKGAAPTPAVPAPAPPPAPPPPEVPAPEEPPAPARKGRFALKLPLPRRKSQAPPEAPPVEDPLPPVPREAPPEPPARAPPAAPPPVDPALWRREGRAWIRTVPGEVPVVRRILDEEGRVVREEPAPAAAVDELPAVRAEGGLGKLLGRLRR